MQQGKRERKGFSRMSIIKRSQRRNGSNWRRGDLPGNQGHGQDLQVENMERASTSRETSADEEEFESATHGVVPTMERRGN
mmetsp:Transcript_17388/g.47990  ORF Transcript_17388/g.47990 Transcript_17388/m.47990 type:complete len:81 (-) Transcript_17388:1022-1264(-)